MYSGLDFKRILGVAIFFCAVVTAHAEQSEPVTRLPQPLTLDHALQYANNSEQYQLLAINEELNQAMAKAGLSDSANDVSVNLSGHLRKVGVSDLGNPDEDDDSQLHLFVRKPIYDFGKSAGLDELANAEIALKKLEKEYVIEQRELQIARRFFDVLNADNDFLRHNEDLAIGFIRWDRAQENQELGRVSEIEVLRLQTEYEQIRQNRYHSENQHRFTRTVLAEVLGFPGSPPSEVVVPELSSAMRISDDVDAIVEQAYRYSLIMQIKRQQAAVAMLRIRNAEHTVTPSLDAELQLSEYARDGATRDDWRASLYFDFPLYAGSRERSSVHFAQAEHRRALAHLQQARSELRLKVLELWQAIQESSLKLQGALITQDYRDMYLDRSRAEYDLEFKTDLGDAMVEFSNSRRLAYQARFELELAWRELEKLVGKEYLQSIKIVEESNG